MKNALDRSSVVRARPSFVLLHLLLLVLAVLASGAGCARLGLGGFGSMGGSGAQNKARPGDEQVALVLEGRDITVGELNELMQDQFIEEFLRQPEDRQYEMRESAIRELVQRHVIEGEAKKKGLTPEALYDEVTAAAPSVSVEDVSSWFKGNASRLDGARLEDVAPQIEQMLQRDRKSEAWSAFLDPKLEALDWTMQLAPSRKTVEATQLVRGPADAPITLITFSDYQCPYCVRSEKILADVLAKYPTQVRLIQRHFPLDQIHPFARPAAEAAMCADEQGQFWAFHDAIFALEGRIDEKSFAAIGAQLGLDGKALETCISERRFKDYVDVDVRAGEVAGVSGTPAFFVNGIPMKGVREVADLSRVIDAELARGAKK